MGVVDPALGVNVVEFGWCKNIASINGAMMPVIKLHCKPWIGSANGG